jgi:transcriptional regulator with XRE-family HTH domain
MSPPASHLLIKRARHAAGLTQQELAALAGTTQSAIARLERADADPRISTLTRVLAACRQELELVATVEPERDDASQLRERLALSPAERLAAFTLAHRNLVELVDGTRRRA